MTKQTRIVVIVGSIVAALLVVTIILVSILIGSVNAQREADSYRSCVETMGIRDASTVEEMADIAEYCSR